MYSAPAGVAMVAFQVAPPQAAVAQYQLRSEAAPSHQAAPYQWGVPAPLSSSRAAPPPAPLLRAEVSPKEEYGGSGGVGGSAAGAGATRAGALQREHALATGGDGDTPAVFRAWFASLDDDGDGFATAAAVSALMRRARLSDAQLARVWDAVPRKGARKGHVDAPAFQELMAILALEQLGASGDNPFELRIPDLHGE
jgi:hypothetical protein